MTTRASADSAMRSVDALALKSNNFCHFHFSAFLSVIMIIILYYILSAKAGSIIE